MSENRETCGLSIASLVTGILGLFPVAIICGHLSLRNIRKNNLGGKGLAIAGMILGYVCFGFMALMLIPLLALLLATVSPAKTPPVVIEVQEVGSPMVIEEEIIEEIEEIEEDR